MKKQIKLAKKIILLCVFTSLTGCFSLPKLNTSSLKVNDNERSLWTISYVGDKSGPDIESIQRARYPVKIVVLAENKSVRTHETIKNKTLLNQIVVNLNSELVKTGLFIEEADSIVYVSISFESVIDVAHSSSEKLRENISANVLLQDTENRTAFKRQFVLSRAKKETHSEVGPDNVVKIVSDILVKEIVFRLYEADMI